MASFPERRGYAAKRKDSLGGAIERMTTTGRCATRRSGSRIRGIRGAGFRDWNDVLEWMLAHDFRPTWSCGRSRRPVERRSGASRPSTCFERLRPAESAWREFKSARRFRGAGWEFHVTETLRREEKEGGGDCIELAESHLIGTPVPEAIPDPASVSLPTPPAMTKPS